MAFHYSLCIDWQTLLMTFEFISKCTEYIATGCQVTTHFRNDWPDQIYIFHLHGHVVVPTDLPLLKEQGDPEVF
jgi:hypothetical protein